MDEDSVKKIINNSSFIANLAPLLKTKEGVALAAAAQAYANIIASLGIKPDLSKFKGCDQALRLVDWCFREHVPDADLTKQWSVEIVDAIAELAAGKMP